MLQDQPGSTAAGRDHRPVAFPHESDPPDDATWLLDDDEESSDDGDERQVRRHREVLAASLVVLAVAFALVEVPGGRVAVRGLTRYPLPHTCMSRMLFGLNCPGCGLTRSFVHLAEGEWAAAWRCHRLGGLMAAVLIFQVPYRLLALRRPEHPLIPARWQGRLGLALVALLIVNWLADVVIGRGASL